MQLALNGRNAVVTGSTTGIGEAIALELASEGARVLIHGRDEARARGVAEAIGKAGGFAAWHTADLTDDESATRLIDVATTQLGPISILVNNAGRYDLETRWSGLSVADWRARLDLNFLSAVRLIHGVLEPMREQGWGRIVNIGSTDAHEPTQALPDYAASKAALSNITISLARECIGTGITANTVTPGYVLTETTLTYLRGVARAREWDDTDDQAIAHRALTELFGAPPGGWGSGSDVAYAVTMLCSPRADWINGADLRVDGGGVL